MSDPKNTLKVMASYVNNKQLMYKLWKLAEDEERHERWESEKRRRHEVSLNGDEKVVTKIEFELANRKNAFLKGITADELHIALAKLTSDERLLIHLLYFQNLSERSVSKLYNCSQNAIHKRKVRVLEKLRICLDI